MVSETLLNRVDIPKQNIHRVVTELDVHLAASVYEEELRTYFEGPWPRFDLVLLGMGEDGHTASLFPNSDGLKEEQRWFISNYAPKLDSWRLSLTKNAINHARNIVVIVSGASKAATLAKVLAGTKRPFEMPIQDISPVDGKMTWLIDESAAALLPESLKLGKIR
jgi:6-phosphogluconolactonase